MKINDKLIKIMESGSNANGSWTKYSDGRMECSNIIQVNDISGDIAYGSFYRTVSIQLGDFPTPFIDEPKVSVSINKLSGASGGFIIRWAGDAFAVTNINGGNVCIGKIDKASISAIISYTAIGRWK